MNNKFISGVKSSIRFNPYTNINYIKIINNTDEDIEQVEKEKAIMQSDTVLMTEFGTQLNAKYFAMNEEDVGAVFTIYKKTPKQSYYQYVCTLESKYFNFTDYNIKSDEFYHYLASAEISYTAENSNRYINYENVDLSGNDTYIHTAFDEWSICDVLPTTDTDETIYQKDGRVWGLGLNIENESLTLNQAITTWDTLGVYPKFSHGNRKYMDMSFTGLLGNMREYVKCSYDSNTETNSEEATTNTVYQYTEKLETYNTKATNDSTTLNNERWNVWNSYARESDKLDAWNEFISNGNMKLLKDTKGNAWLVQIAEATSSSINLAAIGRPTTVTFHWKEADDISNCSIILFGDNTEV